ncbi:MULTISPECIES: hypothetical protein [unclassified Mesorhizobium]|uniref:hypothetical protein n=1 Tax=unclassified Mesorhizobium TaxID=325217 RepID=UPI0015E371F7|nr:MULTISPECIES: hypothetical protein [unclassified Mesorhizobium]
MNRAAGMIKKGAADCTHVTFLTNVVIDFCAKHEIVRIDHREQVAGRVMSLFDRGVTDPDQISIALEKDRAMSRLRRLAYRLPHSDDRQDSQLSRQEHSTAAQVRSAGAAHRDE